jgi:nucleoside-diphosphate-sugar epimerase
VLGASSAADRLLGSLQIDSSKARELLHWQPPLSLEEGIAMAAKVYLKNS